VPSGVKQTGAKGPGGIVDSSVSPAGTKSLLAGVAINCGDPQRGVEIIDQGDVDGTICDCGEILIAGGGFPKWPLLFLAAIPFFFINGDDDFDTPTLTPTPTPPITPAPTPTETPIPEPASLLLFASGLVAFGAGLRRRYVKSRLATRVDVAKEA
jgi:hypothetical protein